MRLNYPNPTCHPGETGLTQNATQGIEASMFLASEHASHSPSTPSLTEEGWEQGLQMSI